MNLLIPVDCKDRFSALLTPIDEHKVWAYVELNAGQIVKLDFLNDKKETDCWVDFVIVIAQNEYVSEFVENDVKVLVAPTQRSIDEIIEAFLLSELNELDIQDD